jgi:hypothetical protein
VNVAELNREAEAAAALVEHLRTLVAEPDDMIEDAIEGETSLKEALSKALARVGECEALADAIKAQADALSARKRRLEAQGETIRAAIIAALGTAGVKKLELPAATLSLTAVKPSLVITDEAAIPTQYFRQADPTIDRRALLSALKDRQTIPGAELSNGGETVTIRWR